MRTFLTRAVGRGLLAVMGLLAVTEAGHAQVAPKATFSKQALGPNGQTLTGPLHPGDVVNFVLSYDYGYAPAGSVTISDQLSPSLTYVNPSVSAGAWTYLLVPYSVGNQETYTNAGTGPAKSFTLNVPVGYLGQKGVSAGDGFTPIVVGSQACGVFHHSSYGSAAINCWDVLSLLQSPGYARSLDTSPSDRRTTPSIVRSAVFGTRIYYPSARYDSVPNKTVIGIGCYDTTGVGASCPFIPLPGNPSLNGQVQGTGLNKAIAGVVADPTKPNIVYMFAINTLYCVDVTGSSPCPGWSPPTLPGGGSQLLDVMVGEGTPTKIYVHYGITSGNKTTVACLDASNGARCSAWPPTDAQPTLDATQSLYGTLSPSFDVAGTMTGVCLLPWAGTSLNDTMACFDASTGGSAVAPAALTNVKAVTAFRIPGNPPTVLYARYQNSPPASCFNFGTPGLCSPFTPGWGSGVNVFKDYGYAVDPAQPDQCLLGLGDAGVIWRFTRDGSFGPEKGCTAKVRRTFDLNSLYCAKKPASATWNTIVFVNPPPAQQLTGGTITVTIGGTTLPPIQYTPGTVLYPINPTMTALGANSQATIEFTPVYATQPTAGYQINLTFTADVDPQICYQATVKACEPVWNKATLAFSEQTIAAGVGLGTATGCEPGGGGVLKVCKVAGPGVAVGTLFTFNAGSSTFTVPAGPPPGGTCVIGPSFPAGTNVSVVEAIPAGDTVSSITVVPASQVVNTNLATGSVDVTMGNGVTEVTFTDKRTGYLEICKRGDVKGSATFSVTPGALGPFVVPTGACSPAIEVVAGSVNIHEMSAPQGSTMAGCATIPSSQQGMCDLNAQTSTVTVAPGDISAQTIAIITNKPTGGGPGTRR